MMSCSICDENMIPGQIFTAEDKTTCAHCLKVTGGFIEYKYISWIFADGRVYHLFEPVEQRACGHCGEGLRFSWMDCTAEGDK